MGIEAMEARLLMAAPVIEYINGESFDANGVVVPQTEPVAVVLPLGKTLDIPILSSDADGDPINYTVAGGDGVVTSTIRSNTAYLRFSVAGFGDLTYQLFADAAPRTVANITELVNNGSYNGLTFHRVVADFIIQGGDPNGDGTGSLRDRFDDEFDPTEIFSGNGQLAMANSGKDTNGSQFFTTIGPQRFLDFNHTIFGQLVRGFDVLDRIQRVPVGPNSRPVVPVVIASAAIVADRTDAVLSLRASTNAGSAPITVTADDGTGNLTSRTFNVTTAADTVNDPPILNPISNLSTGVNQQLRFLLGSTDLEGDPVEFQAIPQGNPANFTASVSGNAVMITPASGFTGTLSLLVGVKQQGATTRGSTSNPFDSQLISIVVAPQGLNAQGTNLSASKGIELTAATVATFTASSPGQPSNYEVTIDWGDSTTSPGFLSVNMVGGFDVTGTHTYAAVGTFNVNVSIRDTTTEVSTTAASTVVVAATGISPNGRTIAATSGVEFAGVVADFSTADTTAVARNFTATIDWGDGTTSAGTVATTGNGTYAVNGSHTYAPSGTFPVQVTIVANTGARAVANSSANVAAAPNPGPGPVAPLGQANLSVVLGASRPAVAPGGDLLYSIIVVNNGPDIARGVILIDNLPPGVGLLSSSLAPVAHGLSSPTFALGDLAVGASVQLTLVVRPTVAGPITNIVRVFARNADPDFLNNSAGIVTAVDARLGNSSDVPRLSSVRRSGSRLTLAFDAALNPIRARDRARYSVVLAGRDGIFGTADDRPVALARALSNASARTVTLRLRRPISATTAVQVRVRGDATLGLTGATGALIDGDRDGLPGGDAVTTLAGRSRRGRRGNA